MNRLSEQSGANAIYHMGQDLVISIVPEVRQELSQLLKSGATLLVIDMLSVNIVDSSGIGCLVAAHNSLLQRHGLLELINVSEDLFELFQSMRLNQHFSIQRSSL